MQLKLHTFLNTVAAAAMNSTVIYVGMLIVTVITFWTGVEYYFDNRELIERLCRRGVKA